MRFGLMESDSLFCRAKSACSLALCCLIRSVKAASAFLRAIVTSLFCFPFVGKLYAHCEKPFQPIPSRNPKSSPVMGKQIRISWGISVVSLFPYD